MKTISLVILLAITSSHFSHSQTKNYPVYKDRALRNLELLSNDFEIKARTQIDDRGIIIYTDHSRSRVDLSIYWTDLPKFIDIVENWDYYDMVKTFGQKGQQAFATYPPDYFHWYKEVPAAFEDLRIAIDPGHFGGNLEEAHHEMRFAKFRAQDVGAAADVQFYEADLAYATALIIQDKLTSKYPGIQVLITRPYKTSALGKSFRAWFKDDFKNDLETALRKGDLQKEMYTLLLDSATHERFVFENFYKFLEFRARVQKIQDFHPDITYAIHFNAKEGNRRFGERYLMPIAENYNMAFVPGAFQYDELRKTDQKIDFIRLLVSTDLEKSIRLASHLMEAHAEILGVPTIPLDNDLKVLREVSVSTGVAGVYARNLVLTRMARGVVVYGESLYQDNIDELKKLSTHDYEFTTAEHGPMKTSRRCAQIAEAYILALERFILENKTHLSKRP